MKNMLFSGLSSLLLPLGAYAGTTVGASYQRTYLSSSISTSTADFTHTSALPRDLVDLSGDQLDIQVAHVVRELVIIDAAVPDKQQFYRALKPGVDIVEINSSSAGLAQLKTILANYKNLAAVHIVSHAQAGELLLGSSRITAENIKNEVEAFAALHGAVREGGDLLFYGCDLAANPAGEELLDIVQRNTHLDVAASNDLTGNIQQQGDWDLEIQRGNIETELAFSEKALKDFSGVLATFSLDDFAYRATGTTNNCPDDSPAYSFNYLSVDNANYIGCGFMHNNGFGGTTVALSNFTSTYVSAFLKPEGGAMVTKSYEAGFAYIEIRKRSGSFQLDALLAEEFVGSVTEFSPVTVVGYPVAGGSIESAAFTGDTTGAKGSFAFSSGDKLNNFIGVNLTKFRLKFYHAASSNTLNNRTTIGEMMLVSFDTNPSDSTGPTISAISNQNIATGGNTGAIAFTVGDNYTPVASINVTRASSNTTAVPLANVVLGGSGANRTVTVTGAVVGTSTITITATDRSGNVTNRTFDVVVADPNQPPTDIALNNNSVNQSGGTNATVGTLSSTDADVGNTHTYTLVAGAGDTNNASFNISGSSLRANNAAALAAGNYSVRVRTTDNASATYEEDFTITVVDNLPPVVSSIAVSGSPAATDTSISFVVSFDALANNISTDDFQLTTTSGAASGTIASVSASSGTSANVTVNGIAGNGVLRLDLKSSTNITDAAGNGNNTNGYVAAFTSGSTHTAAVPTAPNAPTIGAATAGDAQVSVAFTAPLNDGGESIDSYEVIPNPVVAGGPFTGTSSPINVTGLTNGQAYTFTVTATNAIGTSTASGASGSATPKGAQTISFTDPGSPHPFNAPPSLTATADSATGTDNLPVSFSSSTSGVCTVTGVGVLTFVSAGSCTIDVNQVGDTATNAAPTVSRTFTVSAIAPGAPTIGTATAGNSSADVTFSTPASNGGDAITSYTVTAHSPGNPGDGATGSGAGSPITVAGLTNGEDYTFTVTATNSAGTGVVSAASNSITPKASQTITFAQPGAQNFGTSPDLRVLNGGASAGSGEDVAFTSATTSVCTITSEGVLTFVTAGTCIINANQAGNSAFLPAPQVSRTFGVNPAFPGAPTIGTAVAGDTQASVAFVAPADTGGTTITGYTVTVSPPDVAPVNGAGSPIVVTGLTNGQPYTFTVTADNSAGTGLASGSSNSVTPKATQTITFNNPNAQNFGTTPTFSATSDSGLTPTFTSSTTGVCTITGGGAVTFVTAGTCTINANQAGNGSYLAATQVTHSFTVNAVAPGAPTIGAATAGNTQATVTFTAPASNGGVAITGYTVTANPGAITRAATASPYTFTGLTNGTSYTFTVTATNAAPLTGAASAASNAVTPSVPPNSAPVITQGGSASVTMSEDGTPTPFSLGLSATDGDNDTLTWSISSAATNGSASVSGGSVSYIPTANYNGSDSFVVQVSDGDDTDSITVNVTITAVNDAPVISGTPSTSLDQDTAYSFTPTASDLDTADVLTFSISNPPTWASFNTATGALTGTPTGSDSGKTIGIVISVSDGSSSTALPAFDIEVISTIDPLQPIVTAPAELDVDATGLFTPITLRQLLALNPSASQGDIDAALKAMSKDGVSGNDCCTTNAEGLNASNTLLLAPGRHEVKWKATNAVGVSGEAVQIVNIKPLVSLSKSQIAVRGSDVEFRVLLNGSSPEYPFSVPYSVDASTTATAAEHNLSSGTATFTQAGQLEVAIPVSLAAVTGFSDSQLVVILGGGINAGSANRHVIDIRQGNVSPVVSLSISQGGVNTSLITPAGGPVTVTATVTDANKDDTHTFDWSATSGLADTDSNSANASRTFDPAGLTGSHQLQVKVTDSGGANVQASAYFRVVASLPTLDVNTDTDQDGIGDSLEGTGDTDDNGIPDYLDNMPSPNILPQQSNTTNAYLIECDPGVRCGLGLFARSGNSGGVQIIDQEIGTLNDLVIDPAFEPVGGVFDFAIRDLPTPGQSVRVVIPQRSAVPANAVYRKYQRGAWVTFISDADNQVHSAAGNPGYCPPPGSADWTIGLTAGHMCVQLTIEDGGPNDDDGLVNSAVVDPGAVSEAKTVVEPPVEPPKPPKTINTKGGGGAMGALLLTVLGGLVMVRRFKKIAALLALSLGASGTQASPTDNLYLRLDAYQVNGSQKAGDFNAAMKSDFNYNLSKYDVDRNGYQFALGYQWNKFTYTEVGYLDLGDVAVDLILDGAADEAAFGNALASHYPITADGITLVQGYSLSLSDHWQLSPELGLFLWSGDIDIEGASFKMKYEDSTDLLTGLRLDYHFNEQFGVGAGARYIRLDDQHVTLWGVSGRFSF